MGRIYHGNLQQMMRASLLVIPTEAEIHSARSTVEVRSGATASTWIPGLRYASPGMTAIGKVAPGMTRLLAVPTALLVIPAQVEINVRTFPLLVIPRRRESSNVKPGHAEWGFYPNGSVAIPTKAARAALIAAPRSKL